MELTAAMLRYERARTRAQEPDAAADSGVLAELAASRLNLMRLLAEEAEEWDPGSQLLTQQQQDEELLAARELRARAHSGVTRPPR